MITTPIRHTDNLWTTSTINYILFDTVFIPNILIFLHFRFNHQPNCDLFIRPFTIFSLLRYNNKHIRISLFNLFRFTANIYYFSSLQHTSLLTAIKFLRKRYWNDHLRLNLSFYIYINIFIPEASLSYFISFRSAPQLFDIILQKYIIYSIYSLQQYITTIVHRTCYKVKNFDQSVNQRAILYQSTSQLNLHINQLVNQVYIPTILSINHRESNLFIVKPQSISFQY